MSGATIMVPVSKEEFFKRLETIIDLKVNKAIDKHLDKYDEFANWPATMSLKEAADLSGIKVDSIKYHSSKGTIKMLKPDTGSKHSRLRISKKELLKLLIAKDS